MTKTEYLDPQLHSLLRSLRHRIRRYVLIDSLLAVAMIVLSAFWLGLALDYLPVKVGGTEMPRLARTILLFLVATAVIVIVGTLLIGRLHRPLPDESLALLVERQHPQLGGRLVTAVQLNRPDRHGDSHSPALLRKVHIQAAAAIDEVDPNRVFRWQPLLRKSLVAGPLALAAVALAVFSPQTFALGAKRLALITDQPWPRRAHLEMVGVELPVVTAAEDDSAPPDLIEFDDRTVRLPRGSNAVLRIRAQADGAELPVVCTVYYRTDDGTRGQSNMRRVGRVVDGFQSFLLDGPPLADLGESLTFSVRGLDDRLEDYRIETVEPPAISQMKVLVRYPDYLRSSGSDAIDVEAEYQAGFRVREGSDIELVARSTRPLGEVDALLANDLGQRPAGQIQISEDRREFRLPIEDFSSATTVRVVPRDLDGISAQASYRYFLGVVMDEPPELKMELEGIGNAVTPIARIPIKLVATDDYGVEELTVSVVHNQPAEGQPDSSSASPTLNRDGEASSVLDLRELTAQGKLGELASGQSISVAGEATDAYDLGSPHRTRSEVFRLNVVTADELLALLERRELGLRSRLEQTITETRNLRDMLDILRRSFRASAAAADAGEAPSAAEDPSADGDASSTAGDPPTDGDEPAGASEEAMRELQLRRLRAQQAGLQANKTGEELAGIVASLSDLLQEMVNNRVDSVDRRERIAAGVRDPLKQIVEEPLAELKDQITRLEKSVDQPAKAVEKASSAVELTEDVLLKLSAVLDKMLDLESYNEILDIIRELRDDQDNLLEETIEERKKRVLDLFE